MLPVLIKSFLKCINIICRYNPIRQTITNVYDPVGKIKFAHIIFRMKFLGEHYCLEATLWT